MTKRHANNNSFEGTVTFNKDVTLVGNMDQGVAGYVNVGDLYVQDTAMLSKDPTVALEAATKRYVDNTVSAGGGGSWKLPARLTWGPTTNLVALGGLNPIDGVTPVDGDRILLVGQSNALSNGIWIAHAGGWTRAPDADTGAEMLAAAVVVTEGNTYADTAWLCTTNAPITIDTTALTFKQFGASGGTDEVWIGPSDPIATSPSIELWYDDDAVATLNSDMRWYTAWGLIGRALVTTNQSGVGQAWTEITGSRVTFTGTAGRQYLLSAQVQVQGSAGSGVWAQIYDVTAGVEVAVADFTLGAAGYVAHHMIDAIVAPGAVAKTYCIRLYADAGTVSTLAYGPNGSAGPQLRVEDVGPTGGANAAPTEPDLRWFSAWGIVATGTFLTGDGASLTTNVALTSQITYQTLAGRRYRVYMVIRAVTYPTNVAHWFSLRVDGVLITDRHRQIIGNTSYNALDGEFIYVGDGNSHVFDMWYHGPTGPVAYTGGGLFYVEDVGPVTGAAIIPVSPAITAWTAPTLMNSWSNLGSGYRTAGFRKVGDQVYLRGLVTHAGAIAPIAESTIFTLPVGFRPLWPEIFSVNTAGASGWGDGQARIIVGADGLVNVTSANANQFVHSYTSLAGIQFSVTD